MSIEADLIHYIQTQLAGKSTIEATTDLQGIVDSTAVMELVVWIEDNFGFDVEIDDITPEHFGSVSMLSTYIEANKKS